MPDPARWGLTRRAPPPLAARPAPPIGGLPYGPLLAGGPAADPRRSRRPPPGGPLRDLTRTDPLTAPTDIIAAMTHPQWWGPWFARGDWSRWHVFLRALFGLPIPASDLPLYTECTGRSHPPSARATEADAIVGRRGGKTRVMATVAAYLAAFDTDWRQYLDPGEAAHILLVAKDTTQAGVAFGYLSSLFLDHPILRQLVVNATSDSITLRNRVVVRVAAASFRGLRGYAVASLLADELAYWFDGEISANPAEEIIAAIRPAMLQFAGRGMLLCASSPYRRTGPLWNAFRNHWGHPSPTLVWRAPTTTMNPAAPADEIARAYTEDPQRAAAEYGAEFRQDLAAFVDREVVEAAVVLGQHELPPSASLTYAAFVDPSGGANDAFTLAIAHASPAEDGRTCGVLDCLREVTPPFSPEAVVAEFAATLRQYRVTTVRGDRYGGEFPVELFAKQGIAYLPSERSKSDIYREWLPLANSGKIELFDNPRLIAQFCSLGAPRRQRRPRQYRPHARRARRPLQCTRGRARHGRRRGRAARAFGAPAPLAPQPNPPTALT